MSEIPEKIWLSRQWSIPSKREWSWSVSEKPRNIDAKEYEYIRAPQWVSVEDGLPNEEGRYLVMYETKTGMRRTFIGDYYYNELQNRYSWNAISKFSGVAITHWMPLPAPPEVGK